MEDDLNFFKKGRRPQFQENGRLFQFLVIKENNMYFLGSAIPLYTVMGGGGPTDYFVYPNLS